MGAPIKIDLSGGLVPKTPDYSVPTKTTPPANQNIDLTGGLVPVGGYGNSQVGSATPSGSQPAASLLSSVKQGAADLGIGALKGIGQDINGVSALLNKIPFVGQYLAPSAGVQAARTLETPANTAQTIGAAIGNAAPAFLAEGALPEAGESLAGNLARIAAQSGIGAVASPGNPAQGAIVGAGAEGLAQGLSKIAPKMAETALGIGGKQRGFGKTPGAAALQYTHGFSPEAIEQSANNAIDALSQKLEGLYASSKKTVSVQPALDILDEARNKAVGQNNKEAIEAIDAIKDRLTKSAVDGSPLQIKTPSGLLNLKRGIGDVTNWNPTLQSRGTAKLLRQVYNALDSELDRAVPKGENINQAISSLIEARNRAAIESRGAGILQRSAHRVAAHTGALTSAAFGGYAGYRHGGVGDAALGALGGLIIPEALSSPSAQMMAARAMAKAPRLSAPVAIGLRDLAAGTNRGK